MSQYTGRVHLYTCIPGKHSRPEPLFENFHLEELNSIMASSGDKSEATPETLIRNPAYWNVFKIFFEEWNNLRPIERNKLFGKPLQLPLVAELCYLKEGINHSSGVCNYLLLCRRISHLLLLTILDNSWSSIGT